MICIKNLKLKKTNGFNVIFVKNGENFMIMNQN